MNEIPENEILANKTRVVKSFDEGTAVEVAVVSCLEASLYFAQLMLRHAKKPYDRAKAVEVLKAILDAGSR